MHAISLLLPTRGRPALVRRLFQSLIDCSERPQDLEIVLYVDEDDTGSHSIEDDRLNIVRIIGPRSSMGTCNTECYKHSTGELVMLMNDDMTALTRGWDRIVKDVAATIPDGIFLAYPNDMDRGVTLSTFPILSRKTCEIIEDPYPAEYGHLSIDTHIFDLFMRLRRLGKDRMLYLDHVRFKHLHTKDGKGEDRAHYKARDHFGDGMVFLELRQYRQHLARRLAAVIDGKEALRLSVRYQKESPPSTLAEAFLKYSRAFIFDSDLPLAYRLLHFKGYFSYYAAVKSHFTFLRRRSLRSDSNVR